MRQVEINKSIQDIIILHDDIEKHEKIIEESRVKIESSKEQMDRYYGGLKELKLDGDLVEDRFVRFAIHNLERMTCLQTLEINKLTLLEEQSNAIAEHVKQNSKLMMISLNESNVHKVIEEAISGKKKLRRYIYDTDFAEMKNPQVMMQELRDEKVDELLQGITALRGKLDELEANSVYDIMERDKNLNLMKSMLGLLKQSTESSKIALSLRVESAIALGEAEGIYDKLAEQLEAKKGKGENKPAHSFTDTHSIFQAKFDRVRGAISYLQAEALSDVINNHKEDKITMMNLNNLEMDDKGWEKIADALHGYRHLQTLQLSQALSKKDNRSILGRVFNADNALFRSLSDLFESNSSLTTLDLSNNGLGMDGIKSIVRLLLKAPNLQDMNLSKNDITIEAVSFLIQILPNKLKHLDLSDNTGIGDRGLHWLAIFLRTKSDSITSLNLHNCGIGLEASGTASCISLIKHPSLKSLDLSGNALSQESVMSIVKALSDKGGCSHLSLKDNTVQIDGESIKRALAGISKDFRYQDYVINGKEVAGYRGA